MSQKNRFLISNESSNVVELFIEPYGAAFPLHGGEEVCVTDVFTTLPVTLKIGTSAGGDQVLSIWPGDGDVKVEKDGVDVLDLLQNG
jgi:hypothetical protein